MNNLDLKIKIIGIGGCGSNIVSKMSYKIKDVDLLIIDTNENSLKKHSVENKIQIGKIGIGTGSKPEAGKKAFQENVNGIKEHLKEYDLIFIVAGFGGGTGTGILPEIAKLLKEMGLLTISVITKPFEFEGIVRKRTAEQGLKELKNNADSYLVIDNSKLSKIAKNKLIFLKAFNLVDEFVYKVIKEIIELLTIPSFYKFRFCGFKDNINTDEKVSQFFIKKYRRLNFGFEDEKPFIFAVDIPRWYLSCEEIQTTKLLNTQFHAEENKENIKVYLTGYTGWRFPSRMFVPHIEKIYKPDEEILQIAKRFKKQIKQIDEKVSFSLKENLKRFNKFLENFEYYLEQIKNLLNSI